VRGFQGFGYLWCAHTVFLPYNGVTRSAVQWWQITTNGAMVQAGRIDDESGIEFCAFPSLSVNRFNDVLIGFSMFSTNYYASAAYAFRSFNDARNTVRRPYIFHYGEGRYYKTYGGGRNRWGDYSASWTDPANDVDFWTIQEAAAPHVGDGQTDGNGRWASWWAKFNVTVPGNDLFANSYQISGSSGSTNGSTVRALRETGEPNHAGNTNGASIWYNWTPPSAGNVILDTIGSAAATVLAVYTGTSVGSLTLVTNDLNSLGNASRVVFNASTVTYRVAVDGINASMDLSVLNWQRPSTPVFIAQPQSQTKYAGDSVTFNAQAVGNPTATYQWRFTGTNISGATNSNYTKTGLSTNDAGNYTVLASNSSGSATSLVASLTVLTSTATLAAPTWTTNQTFQLTVARETNLNYVVQVNTNLNYTNWVSLLTNTAPFTYTDAAASNSPQRFYRAIYRP
jgi:hypothetical protein